MTECVFPEPEQIREEGVERDPVDAASAVLGLGGAVLGFVNEPRRMDALRESWRKCVTGQRRVFKTRKLFKPEELSWALGVSQVVVDELIRIGKFKLTKTTTGERVTRASVEIFLQEGTLVGDGVKRYFDSVRMLEAAQIANVRFKRGFTRLVAAKEREIQRLKEEVGKRRSRYPILTQQLKAFDKIREVCTPEEMLALCELEPEYFRIDPGQIAGLTRPLDDLLDAQVMSACSSKCPVVDTCPVADPDMGGECGIMRRAYERVLEILDEERGAPADMMEKVLRQQLSRQLASIFYLDLSLFDTQPTFTQTKMGALSPVTDIMPAVEKRMKIANQIMRTCKDLGVNLSKPLTMQALEDVRTSHLQGLIHGAEDTSKETESEESEEA